MTIFAPCSSRIAGPLFSRIATAHVAGFLATIPLGTAAGAFRFQQCRRWLAGVPLGVSMLLGLLMFDASTAHATPVRLVANYSRIGNNPPTPTVVGLAIEGLFDDASLTGIGREVIQLDAINFEFFDPASFGLKAAVIPSLFSVVFNNGTFNNFAGSGEVLPSPLVGLDTIGFASNLRVVHRYAINGRHDYQQFSSSGAFPIVPEPGTGLMLALGLASLSAVGRHRS